MLRKGARPRRLLIIEENRRFYDDLREALVAQGAECEVALDFGTASGILAERRMDLAVVNTDLTPGPDEELIRVLKARAPRMRLVLYHGTAPQKERRRLRRLGADSYLTGVRDPADILRAVERVLGKFS